jgi:molybdate transport system substrate-binding protein
MCISPYAFRCGAAFVAFAIQSQVLAAAEIRVVSTPAVATLMQDVVPGFERTTGHKLAIRYGLNPFQREQIAAGDFDVVIVPSFILDEGIQSGKVAADTRTPLARVQLAVGIRAGAARPDVSSVASFKRAMLNAKSVSYVTDEPSGKTVTGGFERLGIADEMRTKTKHHESVARVWQAVANGEAELGFGLTSNAMGVTGVEVAGAFPSELQFIVVMTAGIGVAARDVGTATDFIRFLQSPPVRALMRPKGLEAEGQ